MQSAQGPSYPSEKEIHTIEIHDLSDSTSVLILLDLARSLALYLNHLGCCTSLDIFKDQCFTSGVLHNFAYGVLGLRFKFDLVPSVDTHWVKVRESINGYFKDQSRVRHNVDDLAKFRPIFVTKILNHVKSDAKNSKNPNPAQRSR